MAKIISVMPGLRNIFKQLKN